jgi:predicted nucleic acid-binding Zn ribbon protein
MGGISDADSLGKKPGIGVGDASHTQTILRMQNASDAASDFLARRGREQRRHYARRPKKIADVLAQLITARGYGRIQANADFTSAWQEAAGPELARFTRPGQIRRGQLEVTVANSTIVQELTFQRERILAALQTALPDARLRDLRFRLGSID